MTRIIPSVSVSHHGMKGFSPRNLKYMRAFSEAWPDAEFVQGNTLPTVMDALINSSLRSVATRHTIAVSVVVFEAWRQNGFAGGV